MKIKVIDFKFYGVESGNINEFDLDVEISKLTDSELSYKIMLYQGKHLVSFLTTNFNIKHSNNQSWFTILKPIAETILYDFRELLAKNNLSVDLQYKDDELLKWIKKGLG